MSNPTIWVGTKDALVPALEEAGVGEVQFITAGSYPREAVSRWCGIEPPPEWATKIIYQAPEEADGSATWREYRHRSNPSGRIVAPEVDLIFARFM